MKKIIRLTESDLVRVVKRVINEQEDGGGMHSAMANLETELSPYGFGKIFVYGPTMSEIKKGDDSNGAHIVWINNDEGQKIHLVVSIDGKVKVDKTYKADSSNDYEIDHNTIIKDLGAYKTYKFKKTPNPG